MSSASFRRGFTLIELLVSISVVAILSGIGIAAYNSFNRRQTVLTAAKTLLSDLRMVQSKAESGEKPLGCNGYLESYELDLPPSSPPLSYSIKANCTGPPEMQVPIKIVTLSESVGLSGTQNFQTVSFNTLRRGVEFYPLTVNSVTLTGYEITKKVKVEPGGGINLED